MRVGAGGVADPDDVDYVRGLADATELGSGPLAARDVPLDAAVDDLVAGREVIVSYVRGSSFSVIALGGESYYVSAEALASASLAAVINAMTLVAGGAISAEPPAPVADTVVRTVTRVENASLRLGPLTGASTVLGLDRALHSTQQTNIADIRTFSIHEVTSPGSRSGPVRSTPPRRAAGSSTSTARPAWPRCSRAGG